MVQPKPMRQDPITILLADDDLDDQELLKEAIISIDPSINVLLFNNGLEVTDYLFIMQGPLPNLILVDYNMPVVSGLEVLERIAGDDRLKGIPTLVWSTSNLLLHKTQCLNNGALKYIVKPSSWPGMQEVAIEIIDTCGK